MSNGCRGRGDAGCRTCSCGCERVQLKNTHFPLYIVPGSPAILPYTLSQRVRLRKPAVATRAHGGAAQQGFADSAFPADAVGAPGSRRAVAQSGRRLVRLRNLLRLRYVLAVDQLDFPGILLGLSAAHRARSARRHRHRERVRLRANLTAVCFGTARRHSVLENTATFFFLSPFEFKIYGHLNDFLQFHVSRAPIGINLHCNILHFHLR